MRLHRHSLKIYGLDISFHSFELFPDERLNILLYALSDSLRLAFIGADAPIENRRIVDHLCSLFCFDSERSVGGRRSSYEGGAEKDEGASLGGSKEESLLLGPAREEKRY